MPSGVKRKLITKMQFMQKTLNLYEILPFFSFDTHMQMFAFHKYIFKLVVNLKPKSRTSKHEISPSDLYSLFLRVQVLGMLLTYLVNNDCLNKQSVSFLINFKQKC